MKRAIVALGALILALVTIFYVVYNAVLSAMQKHMEADVERSIGDLRLEIDVDPKATGITPDTLQRWSPPKQRSIAINPGWQDVSR